MLILVAANILRSIVKNRLLFNFGTPRGAGRTPPPGGWGPELRTPHLPGTAVKFLGIVKEMAGIWILGRVPRDPPPAGSQKFWVSRQAGPLPPCPGGLKKKPPPPSPKTPLNIGDIFLVFLG